MQGREARNHGNNGEKHRLTPEGFEPVLCGCKSHRASHCATLEMGIFADFGHKKKSILHEICRKQRRKSQSGASDTAFFAAQLGMAFKSHKQAVKTHKRMIFGMHAKGNNQDYSIRRPNLA